MYIANVDIQNEIQAMQDKILNYQKLITGNKYKDEVKRYRKKIREYEYAIILLKTIRKECSKIVDDNVTDFLKGISNHPDK